MVLSPTSFNTTTTTATATLKIEHPETTSSSAPTPQPQPQPQPRPPPPPQQQQPHPPPPWQPYTHLSPELQLQLQLQPRPRPQPEPYPLSRFQAQLYVQNHPNPPVILEPATPPRLRCSCCKPYWIHLPELHANCGLCKEIPANRMEELKKDGYRWRRVTKGGWVGDGLERWEE
ncbi:hypothetical protein EX30DRAFT_366062 [Ascodesmis nigricans]|uniref:Uncharacterized protein n=1 Tax=Ascodesmis nigricans TaxID=341454 RepID=A0A4S2MMG0_9PEZI|nr:hypothetical protein EX30DRAFT_366062 [Ascodesmis nigricans]